MPLDQAALAAQLGALEASLPELEAQYGDQFICAFGDAAHDIKARTPRRLWEFVHDRVSGMLRAHGHGESPAFEIAPAYAQRCESLGSSITSELLEAKPVASQYLTADVFTCGVLVAREADGTYRFAARGSIACGRAMRVGLKRPGQVMPT